MRARTRIKLNLERKNIDQRNGNEEQPFREQPLVCCPHIFHMHHVYTLFVRGNVSQLIWQLLGFLTIYERNGIRRAATDRGTEAEQTPQEGSDHSSQRGRQDFGEGK